LTDHDRVGKEVVDSILKKFKQGEWECNGGLGKNFYRIATPKTHPSPDHAFYDDENDVELTFEYKPQTESKRGVLTGLGQSIAYLNKSDISFLVIPKKLVKNNYDIQKEMKEIIGKQIVGKLPVGLIVFDNNIPTEISMIYNVDSLLGRDKVKEKYTGRFWAKHVDLPIPLFHLILHYYYLVKTNQRRGDPLSLCWKEQMLKPTSLRSLVPQVMKDINGEVIRTVAGRKEMKYFEKHMNTARSLSGEAKSDKIKKIKQDARTDFVGDNYYNSVMGKNIKPFLQHIGVVADKELTELGVKLYHLGFVNGPNSRIFRDYFLKYVLEQGHHLDLIFDLDKLTKEYRGKKTTDDILSIMEKEYEDNGMVKRNPNRTVGGSSNTAFLKYEFILWNSLQIKEKTTGKPELAFNWEKITEIRALPEL